MKNFVPDYRQLVAAAHNHRPTRLPLYEHHIIESLAAVMPPGMKAVGGCGFGVFEIAEDLVGYEPLCLLQHDDPDLYAALFRKIGDLMTCLWSDMMCRYAGLFAVCRMGDDLGFKTSMLICPELAVRHVVPQYKRVIDLVHRAGKPFLWHSCGCIFPVMDAVIAAGIDAKHSNEDQIAPFSQWIELYSGRIGLFGGIDVNDLCLKKPQEVFELIVEHGVRYRATAQGYALGSGNSIPAYVPVDCFLAMIEAAKKIRMDEASR
jgi:uroporphyrinogen decarboxylase